MYKPVLSVLLLTLAASFAAGAQDFKLEAHRGICNRYPENTVLSFKQAAKVPVYYGIETDVHLTNDNVLVLHHDHYLKRSCGREGRLVSGLGRVDNNMVNLLSSLAITLAAILVLK